MQSIKQSIKHYTKEAGFTLVELLVGLSVGLIVVGGSLTIYVNTAGSSATTIKSSALNQEMNAIMQLISGDIRRAGFWFDTNTANTTDSNPFTNPAYEYNITIGTWDSDTDGSDESTSTCITLAYDLNRNSKVGLGTLDVTAGRVFDDGSSQEDQTNMEIFGFRYSTDEGSLKMRQSGTSGDNFDCTDGAWWDMNDPSVVTINSFTIDTASTSCLNISSSEVPNDWTTENGSGITTTFCSEPLNANRKPSSGTTDVAVAATDMISENRQINITLTGALTSDSSVKSSLTRSIRVRNSRSITGLTITVP